MTKYALVTGASSGIGYSIALSLSEKGYTVFGAAPERCLSDMIPLKDKGIITFALDITDIQQIKAAVDFFRKESGGNKLDILYNNAGIALSGPGYDFDDNEVQSFINTNLMGHIYMTKYFSEFVIGAKGKIVYTASVAAIIPLPWVSIYCASKAAINTYAKGIRVELEPFGVTVHSVITGGVKTNLSKGAPKLITNRVKRLKYSVPSTEKSYLSAASMTKNGDDPQAYAKLVVDLVTSDYKGFNIYEGKSSKKLKFISSWFPLSLQYLLLLSYFNQKQYLLELKQKYSTISS